MNMASHNAHKRGFSLVEAAIVLGVIGLIIGGIWVGASALGERMNTNNVISGVMQTILNTRKMYSGLDIPPLNDNVSGFAVQSGLVPRDWTYNTASQAINVPGIRGLVYIFSTDPTTYRMSIGINGMSKALCVEMVLQVTSLAVSEQLDIQLIVIVDPNSGIILNTSFPLDLAWATSHCGVSSGMEIGFLVR